MVVSLQKTMRISSQSSPHGEGDVTPENGVIFKAPFTQDAEVLANLACKKWNQLLPIGVFTLLCRANLRANVLLRPV